MSSLPITYTNYNKNVKSEADRKAINPPKIQPYSNIIPQAAEEHKPTTAPKEARTMKEEAIKRLLNDEAAKNQYYFELSKNLIDCIKIVENSQQHNN